MTTPAQRVDTPDRSAAGFFASDVDPYRYDGHTSDPDEVAATVASLVPTGARVLDVGCGTGSVSEIVAAMCEATLIGIEPDPLRAERARARGLDVREGYLTGGLADELGLFDAVIFADVLEHLPDPLEVLRLARRCLTPTGVLVASVPNVAHWSVRAALMRGNFRYESCGIMDATHLRWFTRENIHQLMEQSGMKVLATRTTAGIDLPVYHRSVPWRWMGKRGRSPLLRRLHRILPTMFGCQFVVQAGLRGPQ